MTLVLSQNKNLFESGIWSDIDTNSFLSGHIKNIPNSDVHLISTNGLLQGVLRFGDINFGPLFIDPASRYSTSYGKSSVVYTFNDLEDSFVQKSGRKHAHIWKREQARETISINQLLNIVLGTIKEDLKGLTAASPPAVLQPAQAKPIVNPAPLTPAVAPPTAAPAKGCRMAIIADQSFARNHANEQGGVKNFLAGLMANIAPTYKRQLGVDLIVGQIHVDSDGSALGQLPTNPNSIVSTVNDRAQSSQSPVNPQDFCAVIVMTSANLDGNAVGVGFIGSVCDAGTNAAVVTDNGKTIPTAQLLSIMVRILIDPRYMNLDMYLGVSMMVAATLVEVSERNSLCSPAFSQGVLICLRFRNARLTLSPL